jgi:predicted nucleotidyltransferase
MEKTLKVINELKQKGIIKDYAIGGAIGTLKWVEPFFTRDLDIFIILVKEVKEKEVINLSSIYEYLKERGCHWDRQWVVVNGIPIDFIVADKLEKEAVQNAIETDYEGVKTKILAPEYLIALFIRAGRKKDERKIEMLLEQATVDKGKLAKILNENDLTEKFNKFKENYYE